MRAETKSAAVSPRFLIRRNAVCPAKPPITKNSGMTCITQLKGMIHSDPSLALAKSGPVSAIVTPTIMP